MKKEDFEVQEVYEGFKLTAKIVSGLAEMRTLFV
jgi:hypothetical protein